MMIRFQIFITAAIILGIGFLGKNTLDKDSGMAFLLGALTLGGGFLICGLFSIKMLWHGVIGAGILALLGVGRGIMNLPDLASFFAGERPRGACPLFEVIVLIVCALLLFRVYITWKEERSRKMLAE